MTKEDIIAMARECGIPSSELYHQNLERFAALAIAAERNRTWTPEHWTEYERGIAADERESCAKVCESLIVGVPSYFEIDERIEECAASIRARGQS